MIHQQWNGEGISQIQVTAIKPNKANQQINFFENQEKKNHSDKKNKILDCINERYGDLTIAPSNLIHRSSMPDVIAPAWKPSGHRRTI